MGKKANPVKDKQVRPRLKKVNPERVSKVRRGLAVMYDKDFTNEMTYDYALDIGFNHLERELKIVQ